MTWQDVDPRIAYQEQHAVIMSIQRKEKREQPRQHLASPHIDETLRYQVLFLTDLMADLGSVWGVIFV